MAENRTGRPSRGMRGLALTERARRYRSPLRDGTAKLILLLCRGSVTSWRSSARPRGAHLDHVPLRLQELARGQQGADLLCRQ